MKKINLLHVAVLIAFGLIINTLILSHQVWSEDFTATARAIDNRCISCHDAETREGGVDLSVLLDKSNSLNPRYQKLWVRLEKKVALGEMPPADENPLSAEEKKSILKWFRETFVLRDGKSHIGPTSLRRLTRFELEQTLEFVLAIQVAPSTRSAFLGQTGPSIFESTVPSDIPGESGFDNDSHRLGNLKPPLKAIALAVHETLLKFSDDRDAKKIVLGHEEIPVDASDKEIKSIISSFLTRALRGKRNRIDEYLDIFFQLYRKHREISNDSHASLLHVFEMILLSPEFLYRYEETKDHAEPYPVSGIELAIRLSYFLWSGPPDQELIQVGQNGSLLEDEVLLKQVDRMLNSPKRIALSERFAGQWLGFDELLSNNEYLLNRKWNLETYDEILFFFDELIKSDRSMMELVQSDWIYKRSSVLEKRRHGYEVIERGSFQTKYADIFPDLNQENKREKSKPGHAHYQPPMLVRPRNDREGGIITSPAIMRVTASKNRTSPIRRGVWILSKIIGKDLEPPADVPPLEDARQALKLKSNPTVAELIKQHVSKPECISCHQTIDPLGLGLENYSPVGNWRKRYPDNAPVESAGVMPNGKSFNSPAELKDLLLEIYREEIARNFVENLFAYSLGRKIEPFDRVSLESIMKNVQANGYKMSTVIKQIVLSTQFRHRQDH